MTASPAVASLGEAENAYKERRYSDAARIFSLHVRRHPDEPWGHYMLGLASWKAGELTQAESAFVRSLELNPTQVKSLLNLSRVLLDEGRPKAAHQQVMKALALDSTSGEGYRLLGRVRGAMNQPSEAIAAYYLALRRDSNDVWSMNNLGLLLIQQERYEEALSPLARAVQLDSGSAVFQNNLGIALEHTGHYGLAIVAYRAAVASNSGYTKATLSLARVEGQKEDPSVTPLDLVSLAESFARDLRTGQLGASVAKKDTVPPR